MKRGLIAALLLFLFCLPLVAADLEISSGGYSPKPAMLDDSFRLAINVKNTGSATAENVECSFEEKYGLSAFENSQVIGPIPSGESKTAEYTIEVIEEAASGIHLIPFKCKQDGGEWISQDIEVEIESKYGTLNIKEVKTVPAIVEPGQKAVLYITLENMADYLMDEINIKINLSDSFAPSGESTEKKLRSIASKASEEIPFEIIVLPNVEGGIYKIPFTLTYRDATTKEYSVESYVSINVGSEPTIDADVEKALVLGEGMTGTVSVKLVNRGLTGVRFLNVNLAENEEFDVLSSKNVYIGDLDSDDYETADFEIQLKSLKNEITLPLTLEFRDALNKVYSEKAEVTSKTSATKDSKTIAILIILLVIIGYVIYRYFKKKKRLKL